MSKTDKEILREFLELPLWTSDPVFDRFQYELRSIFREDPGNRKNRFLYIEGARRKKVLLIAHADTYFDEFYGFPKQKHQVYEEEGYFTGDGRNGIGADDRAGCAMLYLLKNSGHTLLITDGEEQGKMGSRWLMDHHPDMAEKITRHQFMIQLDLRNATEFKCYTVGTEPFREFINAKTGFTEPDRDYSTDIVNLCRDITGVNFSIGYYDEHSCYERINISEWDNTLEIVRTMLAGTLPQFSLEDKSK
jgi:hypothetical protein